MLNNSMTLFGNNSNTGIIPHATESDAIYIIYAVGGLIGLGVVVTCCILCYLNFCQRVNDETIIPASRSLTPEEEEDINLNYSNMIDGTSEIPLGALTSSDELLHTPYESDVEMYDNLHVSFG